MPCPWTAATWPSNRDRPLKIDIAPGDWQRLGSQPVNRTALQRSRFSSWSPGHFELEHLHAVSDQLIFIAEGDLLVKTPRQKLAVEAGCLVWLPRNCRHRLIAGNAGCRFWEVVSPNREPHTTTGKFPDASESATATVVQLGSDLALPASADMSVQILHLNSGQRTPVAQFGDSERLWYVLTGSVVASVRSLRGALQAHAIVHVPRHCAYHLEGRGEGDSFVLQLTLGAE